MLTALWTLGLAASATAATIKINVGQSNGLAFGPDTVTAVEGDILEFHFVSGTHQVVSADFAKPCEPVATAGFASPMVQGSATTTDVFKVTVNSTDPIFFYCAVGQHCSNGMVAVVNPTSDKTVAAFKAASKGKTSKKPTGAPFGGIFGPA